MALKFVGTFFVLGILSMVTNLGTEVNFGEFLLLLIGLFLVSGVTAIVAGAISYNRNTV